MKRKRIEDELSSSKSGGMLSCSSPMRSDHGDVVMMDTDSSIPFSPTIPIRSRSCTPSRTSKRFRNGRPSDQEVHQNTLKMLYQAQQQRPEPHHDFSPPVPTVCMPSMPPPQAPPAHDQPSLHSFWKLPSPSPSPAQSSSFSSSSTPTVETTNQSTACEDCGVGLSEEDTMMDDGYGFETYINSCSACQRAVCFSCSVGNLGEQRRCLRCAGKKSASTHKTKKWVGGLGWTLEGVTVC